ncbi:hypothetical protein EI171_00720 (plasmid) [Bradyrhizobium sp. LCT2]|uniref:hypothetical protein n=1 Tax=Bradyrhizobium sp. LCT2 TaxID=2493093 RepID=UPI001373F400|nr:hypothetical protein [Bradyrhizobium sp. LCT2]QHP66096.1 hypothetical protein EI171_00720 [Bradyrhizobium sp. LCT2]
MIIVDTEFLFSPNSHRDRPILQSGAFGGILVRTTDLKSRNCDLAKQFGPRTDVASSGAYFSESAKWRPWRLAATFLSWLRRAIMNRCRRIEGFPLRNSLRTDIGLPKDDAKLASDRIEEMRRKHIMWP